ncbi:MAG TPA: tRNA (adenosine(37)-N6)-threonylcarbamoyltransferase complex ATPase subunit type 1 TsaE [Blastocatellia bacterium]|nr:tRNA (adenosine(37)-N6)-threonylcarbamoyltransferase complex ATPase subunit type 1 TsaE [Blastocatellia bacterium]
MTDEDLTQRLEIITRSAEETFELGLKVGRAVTGRKLFLLSGDLGAGKTIFAKGLAAGLEIDPADVTSPSFTLVNSYEGRLRMYHIDLYRLDSGACRDLGLEEMLEDENAIVVIEWAERLGFTPEGATEVVLEHLDDSERRITLEC